VSEEKLEESLRRLLGTSPDGVSVEKLRALVGNTPTVTPSRESEDKISMKAKEQLADITRLMHQTNYNGHHQPTKSPHTVRSFACLLSGETTKNWP